MEQFQRLANFYFLCLLVLQLVPAISSLTPVTTAIPLIGVLTLTAVKDAYDDIVWIACGFVCIDLHSFAFEKELSPSKLLSLSCNLQQRHMSDNQVNNRKSKTLRNGNLIEEKWADVQVLL